MREERFVLCLVPLDIFGPTFLENQNEMRWRDKKGEKLYLATYYEKRGGRTWSEEDDHWLEFEGFFGDTVELKCEEGKEGCAKENPLCGIWEVWEEMAV